MYSTMIYTQNKLWLQQKLQRAASNITTAPLAARKRGTCGVLFLASGDDVDGCASARAQTYWNFDRRNTGVAQNYDKRRNHDVPIT